MQITTLENRKKKAASRDKNFWCDLIKTWEKSSEHPKDFCRKLNIHPGTFAHWRGIFKKENRPNNNFIEVKVQHQEQHIDQIIIECPNGYKIIVPSSQARDIFKSLGLML